MGYNTGSINSSTPAVALMTALDTEFTGNGWTFVETYTSSTNVTNIYKSPAASNSFGTDFYVGVNRTSTTSTVAFMLGELYNSSTHLFRKYAKNSNTIPDTDYSIVDATGILPTAMTRFAAISVNTSTLFTWWSNVTVDRAMFTSSASTTGGGYVGLFDTLLPSDPFPIAVLNWTGSVTVGTTLGAVTREPLQTLSYANNWSAQVGGISTGASGAMIPYGVGDGTTNGDGFYSWIYSTSGRAAQRVSFYSSRSLTGGLRGLLKDVVFATFGSAMGDQLSYVIGSTTYNYVRAGSTINSIWIPAF